MYGLGLFTEVPQYKVEIEPKMGTPWSFSSGREELRRPPAPPQLLENRLWQGCSPPQCVTKRQRLRYLFQTRVGCRR